MARSIAPIGRSVSNDNPAAVSANFRSSANLQTCASLSPLFCAVARRTLWPRRPSTYGPVTLSESGPPPVRSFREPDLLRSEEHTSELQSLRHLVCRLLLEKKKIKVTTETTDNVTMLWIKRLH